MSDEADILSLLKERARVIGAKGAKAAVGFYSADAVNFDLAPPLAQRGLDVTDPAGLQAWFNTWDGPIEVTLDQVDVRATGNLAIAFGFVRMKGRRTDGADDDFWARMTVCMERRSDEWVITHEHQSFPTRMDGTGLSASDLTPQDE